MIHSLLVTCQLHDVNPYTYLVDVLQRIHSHPMSRVHELTPRIWKTLYGNNPILSPLEISRLQRFAKIQNLAA